MDDDDAAAITTTVAPADEDNKDDEDEGDLLNALQRDELLAWVENHHIKLQGKCATKKGMYYAPSSHPSPDLFTIVYRYSQGDRSGPED